MKSGIARRFVREIGHGSRQAALNGRSVSNGQAVEQRLLQPSSIVHPRPRRYECRADGSISTAMDAMGGSDLGRTAAGCVMTSSSRTAEEHDDHCRPWKKTTPRRISYVFVSTVIRVWHLVCLVWLVYIRTGTSIEYIKMRRDGPLHQHVSSLSALLLKPPPITSTLYHDGSAIPPSRRRCRRLCNR